MKVHLVIDQNTRQQQLDTLMLGCFARDKELRRMWPARSFPTATVYYYDKDTVEIVPRQDGTVPQDDAVSTGQVVSGAI